MKKLICTLLLGASLTGFAQEKFIELTVRDTVMVKPVSVQYKIKIERYLLIPYNPAMDDMQNEVLMPNIEVPNGLMEEKLKELKDILVKNGYKPAPLEQDISEITQRENAFAEKGYAVYVKNPAELKKLREQLKDLNYITTDPGDFTYDKNDDQEKRMARKLVDTARRKAEIIATATGQKPGKVIRYAEGDLLDNTDINIHDIYFQLATQGLVIKNNRFYTILSKTATIAFATE